MKNRLHKSLIHVLSTLLILFMLNNLHAQNNPKQLRGTWELDSVELTKQGIPERYSMATLFADKENLPGNMFTKLYFFDNEIGVNSTDEILLPEANLNLKGSFSIDNDKLIITLRETQPRIFTYIIENDLLKIWYTQDDTHFYLVYKRMFKITE